MSFLIRRPGGQVILLFVLFCCFGSPCAAQGRLPKFKDYPVTTIYRGKNAPLILDKYTRTFKTRLREALKGKPNFAGHYIVTGWGCGTGCQLGAIIDARSGHVHWFPFPIEQDYEVDADFRPIEFRLNSKLIIFSGFRGDREEEAGARFYRFENGRFKFLKFVKREAQSGQ